MTTIMQETIELNDFFGCDIFSAVHPTKLVCDGAPKTNVTSVHEVYARPSDKKKYSNEFYMDVCSQLNGFDFRIIGHTCNFFTCTWLFVNPINGRPMRAVATGKSTQAWYIDPTSITGDRVDTWAGHGLRM